MNNTPPTMERSAVQWLTVDTEDAGRRIDNVLFRCCRGVPKPLIYRLLRQGQVRLNGGRIGPDHRLQCGDRLRLPPLHQVSAQPLAAPAALRTKLQSRILYEDDALMIVDKPAGLAVHGGSGIRHAAIDSLRQIKPAYAHLDLAHRLDRGTSGCLLLAKGTQVGRKLHALLRQNEVQKEYLALLVGDWPFGPRTVTTALRKERDMQGERMVVVPQQQGQLAISRFLPQRRYHGATLMAVEPISGRKHQIRVQAAHIGFPVVADRRYGNPSRQKLPFGLRRMFLHARRLRFLHPLTQRRIDIQAALPADLQACLKRLDEHPLSPADL